MNRKLGQLIKAALFALPLALPGVALAQSAGGTGSDNLDKTNQAAPIDKSMQDKNAPTPENSGTPSPDTSDKTPPAGDLDTSGSTKMNEHDSTGGDINKPSKMDDTGTTTKTKKTTIKKSTNNLDKDSTGNDVSP